MKISNLRSKLIEYREGVLKTNSSPESIAMGFSLATLIAILPTPGFGIFLALFIALFFKKINKIAIVASFAIWNPLVLAPIYWLSYLLGDALFRPDPSMHFDLAIFNHLYHYSGRFILGNATLAICFAITGYLLIYYLILHYMRKRSLQRVVNALPPSKDASA
ncbi:uncharacterized protein (DUF2062 family) [Catalinimonas alkaloidigena]|uniref:DUF2062 domain-containing protein n=1 Tax=Catalinimonas alkaloidigena TaxID=1075417 RepID=UPI0024054C70|nr:DUF2062 domain-containing protein [Catalinimonas alkaloidigena]MDF9797662.1 uncharacterized protein (DUF2062 family) [Catalinimonas alkaloidigena]